MRNIARVLAVVAALLPGFASAQQVQLPANTVQGRLGISPGPAQSIPFATLAAQLGGVYGPISPNLVYAGPTSGAAAISSFRSLVGADLPVPAASTLGGVKSLTCSSHNWLNTISTAGAPGCAQPAFSDLTGSIAASQLPTPGASTLGAINSKNCTSGGQFVQVIGTDGSVTCATPFGNVANSGTPTSNQFGLWVTSTTIAGTSAASKSDQQTATSAVVPVTPSQQQSHPSAAKAWGRIAVSGGVSSLTAGYNIASVSHTGTGLTTVNFTTAFSSSSSYTCVASTASPQVIASVNFTSASAIAVDTRNVSGLADIDADFYTVCFGTQ